MWGTSTHLRDDDLFGAQLYKHALERAELLVVLELRRAEAARGGVDERDADAATALHHLRRHRHDHRGVHHVHAAKELLLEGRQPPGRGLPARTATPSQEPGALCA